MTDDVAPNSPATTRYRKLRSRWHTVVPLVMIAVATLAAGTAYVAAVAEQRTTNLERMLAQGHLIGMTERQRLLDQALANARLSALRHRYLELGRRLADRINKNNPPLAARYMLEAQTEFAAARVLLPFLDVAWNPIDSQLGWEQSLQRSIVWPLVNMGFDVAWSAAAPAQSSTGSLAANAKSAAQPPSIWHRIEKRIDNADSQVLSLTLGVVLFVSGLLFLTLSDVSKRLLFVRLYFAIGLLIATGATAYVIKLAPEVLRYVPYIGLFFVVLAAIGWKLGSTDAASPEQLQPGEVGQGAPAGVHQIGEGPFTPFTRTTVLLISLTVLLSALCAYGYSKAESSASDAAVEAMQHEVEMHTRSSRSSAAIYSIFDGLAEMLDIRVREKAARQYAGHLTTIGDANEAEMAAAHADALKAINMEKQNENLVRILDDPYLGVTGDPRFPERIQVEYALRNPGQNYWEPFALWDASNHKSLIYHKKATAFLGTLSVIAIALYILGQALSMPRAPLARALVAFSVLLVGAASAWAASVVSWQQPSDDLTGAEQCRLDAANQPEQDTPDGYAARYFAIGMALFDVAHTRQDFERASRALHCSVVFGPDFALARRNLSVSLALAAAASQSDDSYYSITTKAELGNVLENRKRAVKVMAANGYSVPAPALNDVGTALLWLGVARGDLTSIKSSIAQLREADRTSVDGGDAGFWRPMIRLNIGVAALIAGEEREADEAVERAIEAGAGGDPNVVKSTLTVIRTFVAYCARIHSDDQCKRIAQQGLRMRQRLVSAVWPDNGSGKPKGAPVSADNVAISVDGQSLRWRADLHNFDPKFDRAVVIWYVRDREWDSWRVLPPVSGAQYPITSASAAQGIATSYLLATDFRRCLNAVADASTKSASRYLAEIYLNGNLVAELETADEQNPFEATRLVELNVGLCRPRDWRPLQVSKEDGKLVSMFATAGGKPALLVVSSFSPARQLIESVPGNAADAVQGLDVIAQAKGILLRQGWINGSEVVASLKSGARCTHEAPAAELVSRHWTTPEGVEHVAMALKSAAPWNELCSVLQSIDNRFAAVSRLNP